MRLRTWKHLPQSFLHLLERNDHVMRRHLNAWGCRNTAHQGESVLRESKYTKACVRGPAGGGRDSPPVHAARRAARRLQLQHARGARDVPSSIFTHCAARARRGWRRWRGGGRLVFESEPGKVFAKLDLCRRAVDRYRGSLCILCASSVRVSRCAAQRSQALARQRQALPAV